MKLKLSPSKMNLFNDCKRCSWLSIVKKIDRPRGIFPSLPGGMDLIIKTYYDKYRDGINLPPKLAGKIDGVLVMDMPLLDKWRNWRTTNLKYESNDAVLTGALDDCIINKEGFYAPLDNKTKGGAFKEDPAIYAQKYYQLQLDSYTLMLDSSGYKTNQKGYFVFFYPKSMDDFGQFKFELTVIQIKTDKENAIKKVKEIVDVINSPTMPEASANCEYCNLVHKRKEEK